jgi:hypothetical protein
MIEAMMRRAIGTGTGASGEDTPQGQQLPLRAYQAGSDREAVELARQALTAWPDCADAYVLLAESARTIREGVDRYARGIAAGARRRTSSSPNTSSARSSRPRNGPRPSGSVNAMSTSAGWLLPRNGREPPASGGDGMIGGRGIRSGDDYPP